MYHTGPFTKSAVVHMAVPPVDDVPFGQSLQLEPSGYHPTSHVDAVVVAVTCEAEAVVAVRTFEGEVTEIALTWLASDVTSDVEGFARADLASAM